MEILKNWTRLKALEKDYHLEFDRKEKYYTGNAYKNSEGEYLPKYFPFIRNGVCKEVYELKYFDGCFNPFMVNVTLTDRIRTICNHELGKDFFFIP